MKAVFALISASGLAATDAKLLEGEAEGRMRAYHHIVAALRGGTNPLGQGLFGVIVRVLVNIPLGASIQG